jgi:cytochrome c553
VVVTTIRSEARKAHNKRDHPGSRLQRNGVAGIKLIGLISLLIVSAAHSAEQRPASSQGDPMQDGHLDAMHCRHCHGETGNSMRSNVPNLAGQNPAYLYDQMNKFANGERRSDAIEGLIRAFSPQRRARLALYFSRQAVIAQPVRNPIQAAKGKTLYVRLCLACHGESGAGTDRIPRLAGQQIAYLQQSLMRYRNGSRDSMNLRMASNVRSLDSADIASLSVYLGSLR